MMTTVLFVARKVILVTIALRCSATTDDFSHFAQDCPEKIAPSTTLHHHNISHSHSHHNHSHKDRSHSFHHRYSQGNRSGSCHQFQHDRSSSHHWRNTSHSISCHNSCSCYPSTGRYLRRHSQGVPHTATGATHPDTYHARATPDTTQLITVSLTADTPWALPIDCTQGRHWSHIHGQRPPSTPAPQDGHYSGVIDGLLLRIRWWFRYFKLLGPSSSSDKDLVEWGGQPQPH